MMRMYVGHLRPLLMLLLIAFVLPADAGVKVERLTYHGWPDSYRITNGIVEVIAVPRIGRIMLYRFLDGENVLWDNPDWSGKLRSDAPKGVWANFGGDKVWPAPQNEWADVMGRRWPPDEAFDGGIFSFEVLPDGIRLTSPVSPHYGARVIRELHLSPDSSRLLIGQKVEKLGPPVTDMIIWSVTQIKTPDLALMPLNPKSEFPEGFKLLGGGEVEETYRSRREDLLLIRRHPEKATKVGADSPAGWLASFHGDLLFMQRCSFYPKAEYPDGGCNIEIYTNPDPLKYVELELLSPIHRPKKGESFAFDISWQLYKLPHIPRDDEERIRIVRKIME